MDASPERHPDDLSPDDVPQVKGLGPRVPRGVLWALALLVVVLVIASWVAMSAETRPTASTGTTGTTDPGVVVLKPGEGLNTANQMLGQAAPPVKTEALDGGTLDLAAAQGKPMVINFWSSTCVPCVTEMPDLERVHQRYGDKVAFAGIDVLDRDEGARDLARRTGVTYPLGFDRDGQIAQRYGALGLPTTVLVDRNGTIVVAKLGITNADDLSKLIDEKLQP